MILLPILFPYCMTPVCFVSAKRSERERNLTAVFTCALEMIFAVVLLFLPDRTLSLPGVCGTGLSFALDGFRKLYCMVTAFAWFMTTLFGSGYFAGHENSGRYYVFNLLTLGATMGVFLSSSLFTALVFFEIMSFASYTWVIQDETEESVKAANTYLTVAVIGGMAALMGLFLLQSELGTTEISLLSERAAAYENKALLYTAGGCVLFGFGAKAGMFPLHIWLPKAHPVAPAPASALLSGILTKSGIFGVVAITCSLFRSDPGWGTLILILGTVTMVLGAILGLFSVNLKRTLACSSVSQIGFVLTGIGMTAVLGSEEAAAASGAVLHMLNHSLFKLVLFLCAGVVHMNTHRLDLNDVRGFGRGKPVLMAAFLSGALGISGFPLFSGYVSKTLLHESIAEYAEHLAASGQSALLFRTVEALFLFAGGMTAAYMTKLFVVLFLEKNGDPAVQAKYDANRRYLSPSGTAAVLIPAALIPVLGCTASFTMGRIAAACVGFFRSEPMKHAAAYFSWSYLKGSAVSLLIGLLLYFFFVRLFLIGWNRAQTGTVYLDRWPKRLDLEELLYRPLIEKWIPALFGPVAELFGENRLTGPLVKRIWSLSGSVAALFGENRLTALLVKRIWSLSGPLAVLFGENRLTGPVAVFLARTAHVAAHACSDSLDALIYLLRRTVYRPAPPPATDEISQSTAYRFGRLRNRLSAGKTPAGPQKTDYGTLYYRRQLTRKEVRGHLTDNLSFAIVMFCIAAVAIMLYVLRLN